MERPKEVVAKKNFEEEAELPTKRPNNSTFDAETAASFVILVIIFFIGYKIYKSGIRWFDEFFANEPFALPVTVTVFATLIFIFTLRHLNGLTNVGKTRTTPPITTYATEKFGTTEATSNDKPAENTLLNSVKHVFQNNRIRINLEIENLIKRGNHNLSVGLSVAMAAFLLLAFSKAYPAKAESHVSEIAGFYSLRVSTVILLQIISFFFLRLYKSSITQTEYYQSELTRISTNEIAIETAISTGDKSILFKTVHAIIQSQPSHPQPWAVSSEPKLDSETVKKLLELASKA